MKRDGCNTPLHRAEQRVIRAAAGCVNVEGWSFEYRHMGVPVAHFPDALRRLESALANLRSVRRHNRNVKRRSK